MVKLGIAYISKSEEIYKAYHNLTSTDDIVAEAFPDEWVEICVEGLEGPVHANNQETEHPETTV